MHIPQHMLHGTICPITLSVGLVGVGSAIYFCRKADDSVTPARWAAVSTLMFTLQMLNYPIMNGISGHLVGGVLAVGLLGIPRAIITLAMVILTQAVFFGDGGIDALGANLLNMSLIGTGLGGLVLIFLKKRGASESFSLAIASLVSVVLAALACSFEVYCSTPIAFWTIAKTMISVHAIIGIGEAILTVVLFNVLAGVLNTAHQNKIMLRTSLCSLGCLLLAPLASQYPDGLDWAASYLNLSYTHSNSILAWFRDYQISGIDNFFVSTFGAGLCGAALIFLYTKSMAKNLAVVSK